MLSCGLWRILIREGPTKSLGIWKQQQRLCLAHTHTQTDRRLNFSVCRLPSTDVQASSENCGECRAWTLRYAGLCFTLHRCLLGPFPIGVSRSPALSRSLSHPLLSSPFYFYSSAHYLVSPLFCSALLCVRVRACEWIEDSPIDRSVLVLLLKSSLCCPLPLRSRRTWSGWGWRTTLSVTLMWSWTGNQVRTCVR